MLCYFEILKNTIFFQEYLHYLHITSVYCILMMQHEQIILGSLHLFIDNFPPSRYVTLSFYIRSLYYHETNSHMYISGASEPIH